MPQRTAEGVLPCSPEQLFDLVADVERYPEFVPGWVAARLLGDRGEGYVTEQIIRWGPINHRFRTRTRMERPHRIAVASNDGPFRKLDIEWGFVPLAGGRCRVRLAIDMQFRSSLLQCLAEAVPDRFVRGVMAAFEKRAERLFGVTRCPVGGREVAARPAGSDAARNISDFKKNKALYIQA